MDMLKSSITDPASIDGLLITRTRRLELEVIVIATIANSSNVETTTIYSLWSRSSSMIIDNVLSQELHSALARLASTRHTARRM